MFQQAASTGEQLQELQAVLGLDWDGQDWGIVNADGSRVEEFASYFQVHFDEHWSKGTLLEYVDLVMESACTAIQNDPAFDASCIDDCIALAAPHAPGQVKYWTSPERAIAAHLRQLGF